MVCSGCQLNYSVSSTNGYFTGDITILSGVGRGAIHPLYLSGNSTFWGTITAIVSGSTVSNGTCTTLATQSNSLIGCKAACPCTGTRSYHLSTTSGYTGVVSSSTLNTISPFTCGSAETLAFSAYTTGIQVSPSYTLRIGCGNCLDNGTVTADPV